MFVSVSYFIVRYNIRKHSVWNIVVFGSIGAITGFITLTSLNSMVVLFHAAIAIYSLCITLISSLLWMYENFHASFFFILNKKIKSKQVYWLGLSILFTGLLYLSFFTQKNAVMSSNTLLIINISFFFLFFIIAMCLTFGFLKPYPKIFSNSFLFMYCYWACKAGNNSINT
jgi:hypothetical protein